MKRLFTSFFILLTASGLWAQDKTYKGETVNFSGEEYVVRSAKVNIPDSGTITDLDIKLNITKDQLVISNSQSFLPMEQLLIYLTLVI